MRVLGGIAALLWLAACDRSVTVIPVAAGPEVSALSGLAYERETGLFWTVRDSGDDSPSWPVFLVGLRIDGDRARAVRRVRLTWPDGRPVSGDGLDPEGIGLSPRGTFWLCDERGPWLLEVGRDGRVLRRVTPPEPFSRAPANRGFEGIAVSEDGRRVYAVLQRGLPEDARSRRTRLLVFEVESGRFRVHPYPLGTRDAPQLGVGVHGLALEASGALLAVERDARSGREARVKRVYRLRVPPQDGAPVEAELAIDLLSHGYAHEKPEGVAITPDGRWAILNDDDGAARARSELWLFQ